MQTKLIHDKYQFLKKLPYKSCNYEGIEVFYNKQTFIKLFKNSNITLTNGKLFIIIKKSYGLKEGAFTILNDTQIYNKTNGYVYCVLNDCLLYKEENKNKLFIENGTSEDELL